MPGGRRPTAWRPVLLSGLVFPGLGQLATGHPGRALVYGGGTVLVLLAVLRRVVQETLARLPEDPASLDPLFPLRLAHEIHVANATYFFWLTLALVVLWAGSVIDAWRASPSAGRSGPRPSSARPR
jgi:hypothetical protein